MRLRIAKRWQPYGQGSKKIVIITGPSLYPIIHFMEIEPFCSVVISDVVLKNFYIRVFHLNRKVNFSAKDKNHLPIPSKNIEWNITVIRILIFKTLENFWGLPLTSNDFMTNFKSNFYSFVEPGFKFLKEIKICKILAATA